MSSIASPYRLIVEEPTYEVKFIVEEQNRSTPSNMFINGPFLMANEANKNKRIYPLDEMVNEVSRYKNEMIIPNRSLGSLNHPSSHEIDLKDACHLVKELKQDGNIFEGKSKILTTPMGQITRSLILDGVRLGVSSRSLGQLTQESNGNNRVSNFRLIAVDVVADPSVPTAFVNGILESKQWVLNDYSEFEPVYDKFENALTRLPKKQKDEYVKEQMLAFIQKIKELS